MNPSSLRVSIQAEMDKAEADCIKRMTPKSGVSHEDYCRLNGELWGLRRARSIVDDAVNAADK